MSVVVGLVDKSGVYLGADAIGVDDVGFEVRRDAKVWERGPMLIGFAGSYRAAQILRYAVEPPKRGRGKDPFGYLVTVYADHLRSTFKAAGYEPKSKAAEDDGTELAGDCNFLIAYEGRLFRFDADLAVAEVASGFDAIGAGAAFAIGALWQQESDAAKARRNKREPPNPRERVLDALNAADKACHLICRPFTVLALEK